jgi:hypothetical protein
MTTPICITVLRLMRRYCGGREAAEDDEQCGSDRQPADLLAGEFQRCLGQHQQRTTESQIVSLDEADCAEDQDNQHVIGAERNAIELAAKNMAGRNR